MVPINDTIATDGWPWLTTGLVLANLVVYVLAAVHGGSLLSGPDAHEVTRYGVIPYALTHPGHHGARPWTTVLTAMILHGSVVHLLVDVGFLAIFGSTIEDATGPLRLLAVYVAGGIAAVALMVAVAPNCAAPFVGAQGAVAATIGAYVVIYPRAQILVFSIIPFFFTVFEVPALVIVAVWFAAQAAFGAVHLVDPLGGGGWFAYVDGIGGFLLGALAIRALRPHLRVLPPARPLRPG